jgi:hypothetical protein
LNDTLAHPRHAGEHSSKRDTIKPSKHLKNPENTASISEISVISPFPAAHIPSGMTDQHPHSASAKGGPTELERFAFDLQGFIILRGALERSAVAAANAAINELPDDLPRDSWHGAVHRENIEASRGIAYQQIYELPAFTSWIDHPAWIDHARHFIGGHDTFDGFYGDVFIDENFASLRGPHEAIGIHSGGHSSYKRTSYRFHNGDFMSMQINVLVALNNIGPGDGATVVVPASHKANLAHPDFERFRIKEGSEGCDAAWGAQEVHLQAGDAILFTDAILHGSAKRLNDGQRRIAVFRYSPAFCNFRYGYRPSQNLLDRLTPEQRRIVMPFQEYKR